MQELKNNDVQYNINLVIKLAKETYPDNKVMAGITAAQAILEAGLRNSPPSTLALKYNNLFGIKKPGTLGFVNLRTDEYINGKKVNVNAAFGTNNTVQDSIQQHKEVLELDRYKRVREAKTIEEAAKALKDGGYATDLYYPQKIVDVYNKLVKDKI